jgi:mannose-6-phosphate isomerase-like protein (cupin superfamily)
MTASAPTFHVSAEDTDGEFLLMELSGPHPGASPHYHEYTTELFFMLEGSSTVTVGEHERTIGPGESALVPPNTVHSFTELDDEQCRMLALVSPGEFEEYFREIVEFLGPEGWPPDDIDRFREFQAALAERHDIYEPPVGTADEAESSSRDA